MSVSLHACVHSAIGWYVIYDGRNSLSISFVCWVVVGFSQSYTWYRADILGYSIEPLEIADLENRKSWVAFHLQDIPGLFTPSDQS